MVGQELLAFVKKMRKEGIDEDTIKKRLFQRGWGITEIEPVLRLTRSPSNRISQLIKPNIPKKFGGIIYCQKCGESNSKSSHFCQNCGANLITGESPTGRGLTYSQLETLRPPQKSPIVACLLNLLIIGAGFWYLGKWGTGFLFLFLAIFAAFMFGIFGSLAVLILAMIISYSYA